MLAVRRCQRCVSFLCQLAARRNIKHCDGGRWFRALATSWFAVARAERLRLRKAQRIAAAVLIQATVRLVVPAHASSAALTMKSQGLEGPQVHQVVSHSEGKESTLFRRNETRFPATAALHASCCCASHRGMSVIAASCVRQRLTRAHCSLRDGGNTLNISFALNFVAIRMRQACSGWCGVISGGNE